MTSTASGTSAAAAGHLCQKGNACAIVSAGWDPGADSIVRALMLACVPRGITHTNFGPGMSMGHTVCVKSNPA